MIRRIFKNLYFLTFLNGFLLATLFYFKMEANYEQELFRAIQLNIDNKIKVADNKDSLVVRVMHACNALLNNRATVFEDQAIDGFKVDYLHPTSIDLMTAKGACGSYSMVLTRIFKNYNFPVRIAQMKVEGVYAAHNVVEVKSTGGWVVLDPLFNVYFVKPGGSGLASFADVKNNWGFYNRQLPAGYDRRYRYEDVRYSNWNKIPVLSQAVKKILDLAIGKENADNISLRTYFLETYDLFFYITLFLYLPIFLYTMKRLVKTKVFPQPNIPFTFPNLVRYSKARFANKQFKNSMNA
jgi:hypothetical protein